MILLLDTQVAIWAAQDSPRLSGPARSLLIDPGNEVVVSAVSLWEIAIKFASGKLPFSPGMAMAAFRASGYRSLAMTEAHAGMVANLPDVDGHKDPFDRMLVAQALTESMRLVTADAKLACYPVGCIEPV